MLQSFFNFLSLLIKKKFFRITLDIFLCLIATSIFLYLINLLNFGEIRGFLLATYVFGFLLLQKTLGKLFAIVNDFVYNMLIKSVRIFKTSSLGKKILK